MKKLLSILALAVLFGIAVPGTDLAGWETSYDKAVAEAKAKKKPILALFTGSDWCPYCIKLEKNVLTQPEFKRYTRDNVVLLYLDFPRKKQLDAKLAAQNNSLAEKYKIVGFPTSLLLSADGRVIGQVQSIGPVKNYVELLKQLVEKK